MLHSLSNNIKELIVKLKERWGNLSLRDKRILTYSTGPIIFVLFFMCLWLPYYQQAQVLRNKMNNETQLLQWMRAADAEIQHSQVKKPIVSTPLPPVAILSLLQKTIDKAGLGPHLKLLKQVSNDSIDLTFEKVSFDKLISLLISVTQNHPLTIEQFTSHAQGDGLVNAQMTLKIN